MTSKAKKAKSDLMKFRDGLTGVLERVFKEEVSDAENYTDHAVDYISELRNITLAGGKRLRGSFVFYSYLMNGGKDLKEILKISAAIEIIHSFLLVEDDFMDIAETRRGYPTIHETYLLMHKQKNYKKESTHFGNAIAVNVGIIADHIALNIIVKSGFPDNLKLKALDRLNRQIITVGHGQVHDMLNEVRLDLTEHDIVNVLYWKSGIYTYDNPIIVGAILAGACDEKIKALSEYAIPGGVAFQIQDDILGTFGDEEKMGKPADSDIKEGKQTLLTYKSFEKASKGDRAFLEHVIGNQDATKKEIEKVRKIFIDTGALEYSKKKAIDFVTKAKDSLIKNAKIYKDWKQEGIYYLEGIADYMIDREL